MASPKDELKAAIAAGNAVIVAGTGVSVATMAGKEPLVTWKGLLLDGLGQCKDGKIVQAIIETLNGSPSLDDFLMAATMVETTLGKAKRTKWLNVCLGGLQPLNTEVIEAIGALNSPILTTNYDTLISKTLKRDAVAWTNAEQSGELARGDTGRVLHLHGVYTEAESVVLGWCSYTKVADHAPSTLLKGALGLMKSFVFIGCGIDGLTDPDLGPFFATYGPLFDGGQHFRICHKDEASATPHGITCVTYDHHDKLAELLRELAPAVAPEEVAVVKPAYRLERPPEHFVGRDAQRELLRDRMQACQPTLVTGPAGMGKSALCLAALHDEGVAAKYGTRRWFVRLDGATTTATMMGKVGEAMGLAPDQWRPPQVRDALAQSPGALVLDNFETPWHGDEKEAEAELAQLRALPGLALAVGVRGDKRPMDWLELPVGRLTHPFDRELFLVWAGQDFADDPALDGLVASLEGWPLVLRLLGREAEGQADLADLTKQWREYRLKASDEIGASLDLSWNSPRLPQDAKRLLSLMGRLPDGIARADLEIVMPGGRAAAPHLVGIGLAHWSEDRDRLLTLAPIRQHLEKAHPPEDRDWAPCRDHYLKLATAAEGEPDGKIFARLTPETGNVATVIAKALENPAEAKRALTALLGFGSFNRFTGLGEALPLLRRAADMGLGDRVTATCYLKLGMIAVDRAEVDATDLLTQARGAFARLGDRAQEAECLFRLGELAVGQNHWEEAENCFAQAETGFGPKHPVGIANCRFKRGTLAKSQGRVSLAIKLFRDALTRYRRLDRRLGQGNALYFLAECAHHQKRLRQARKYLEQASPLFQEAGNIVGAANCYCLESDMALRRNDFTTALAALTLALPLYERKGSLLGQGNCWRRRGLCAEGQKDSKVAHEYYAKAQDFYARIPDPGSMAMVKADMAGIAKGKERKRLVAEARAVFVELGLEDDIRRIDARFPDLAPPPHPNPLPQGEREAMEAPSPQPSPRGRGRK